MQTDNEDPDRYVGGENVLFRANKGPLPRQVRASMMTTSKKSMLKRINASQSALALPLISTAASPSPSRSSTPKAIRKSKPASELRAAVAKKSILISATNVEDTINRVPSAKPKLIQQESKTRKTIPGNAGASLIMSVPLMSMPEGAHPSNKDADFGRPSILRLQAMSPNMLQMETLKQQHQLNRMASIRHSAAVHALNSTHDPHAIVHHHHVHHDEKESGAGVGFETTGVVRQPSSLALSGRRRFTILTAEESAQLGQKKLQETERAVQQWTTVTSVRANDLYNVTKYISGNTGLEVIHAKLDSPTVHGYFVTAHKCENDWGLPHILAHMIFLGSRNYPTPGVLDQLASKCLASGTNAWTDSDHACYTLTTAGKQGFLSLLPVYLDHIFFPALGEASFLTEVHHINGRGEDGGVCYSEMKAIEHDPLEQAHWSLLREIYGPDSGYYYNYGGHSKEMRESCTLQSVKQFHKQYYHPRNCCLIICGDVEKDELFNVLNPFMDQLEQHDKRKSVDLSVPWIKPWQLEPPVEIPEVIESVIKFPSESEGMAQVKVGIVGPLMTEDVNKAVAMHLLMQYLLDSPVSPIQMEFVEHENALATHVHLTEINHVQSVYSLNFENVPVADMKHVPLLLRRLLEKQIENSAPGSGGYGGFDIERMEFIVSHCYQKALSAMENSAEDTIAKAVIGDFLYGKEDTLGLIFDHRINQAYTIDQFTSQTERFWIKMIELLLNSNWATVYMVPSRDHHEQNSKDEAARVASAKAKLGESGRKKLAARLKAAVKIQNRPAPPEMLNAFQTPDVSSIGFLGIERSNNPAWAADTLCNVYLDDINSSYVYLTTVMDTSELTLEEKKYLVLFAEAILEAPYVDNSQTYFTYEQMVAGLSRDVLKYETFFGLDWDEREGTRFSCGSYSHLFCIRFQMEMRKVKEGFEWMQLLLWNTKWQADRLKIIAQRLAGDVNHLQDRGSIMSHAIIAESLYQMNSNVKAMNLIRQQCFLERLAQDLPKQFKKVAKMLEAIRMVILRPENTTVHVATSLPKMEFYLTDQPEVQDAIAQLLRRTFDYTGWHWGYQTKRLANDPESKWMKGEQCIGKCVTEAVLRMHSDEGCYLIQAAPCIRDYKNKEYPLILTAIQYFCQHEGPFHKAIRNTGFASGFFMKVKPQEGLIYFELKPCVDLVGAYCAAFDIIHLHVASVSSRVQLNNMAASQFSLDDPWKESLLQSAKSSAIFELIEKENTPRNLAIHSLLDYFHEVPNNFSRSVMERIAQVTMDEVKEITNKYFTGLFIETCTCSVAAPVEKVPSIIKGLMDHCGKRLSLLPPVHQSEMTQFT